MDEKEEKQDDPAEREGKVVEEKKEEKTEKRGRNPYVKSEKPERIKPRVIEDEMKESYLDYSMSVIVGRALPDVRDGLKPVHRRILYAMHDMGMFHNKPFKKCARIVGEVLGKYHPHGDMAVYDSLVRMVQTFSLRYPLIDGQGNFGSVDGDAAAAMRYTEARMARIAEELLADIEKDTVDFRPNFDGSLKEPVVLPAKLPNLLINGSSGIAVGMATNIPPHNIEEVIDGIISIIDNPEISLEELAKIIKGPDFPTGGQIIGRSGIMAAYSTGRGKITVRGKTEIEESKSRKQIVIKEIPYQLNKTNLIQSIADLIKNKRVKGIGTLRDESDKEGMRIVVELHRDASPEIVLNQLYKNTPLQSTFGIIMLTLVGKQPKVLGLKDIISEYIFYRKDVVTRRTRFELDKAEKRAHILEGLMIALEHIDDVIKTIKQAHDVDIARKNLISGFSLTEVQAQAILEMKLQRLTNLEQTKIKQEHSDLVKLIVDLKDILGSEKRVYDIIKKELLELKDKYNDERMTEILDNGDEGAEIEDEQLIKKEDVVVIMTHDDYIKRLPLDAYKQQRRGGKGVIGTRTKETDIVKRIFVANTHDYLLFFTNKGKVYWMKAYQIPDAGRYSKGKAVINLLNLQEGERVASVIPVSEFKEDQYLLMATKLGVVKKTSLSEYSNPRSTGIIAINLRTEDDLVNVLQTDGSKEVVIATKNGSAVRFKESDVRPMGRSATGVRGIRLKKNDNMIDICIVDEGSSLLTVTENGYGKRTPFSDYSTIHRGGKGVINIKTNERNGSVAAIETVKEDEDILLISKNGIVIRVPVKDVSEIGRNTQGVTIMKLEEGDKVIGLTKISRQEKEEEGNITTT
jgi:DNA gyrase subunit A